MHRFLHPFVLVVTAVIGLGYAYAASRLAAGIPSALLLAVPFFLIWIVPLVYWVGEGREERGPIDEALHIGSYLAMGAVTYLMLFLLLCDLAILVAGLAGFDPGGIRANEPAIVLSLALIAMIAGLLGARNGPRIREVEVPVEGLPAGLNGFRIVQITDLHVGPTIRRSYVERVVRMTEELKPDLVALTGDIVDGTVTELARDVEPLSRLGGQFLALGNHDYYSGAREWTARFTELGLRVLQNEHVELQKNGARLMVAGVLDPAAKLVDASLRPDPQAAATKGPLRGERVFKLLLAHNPKIAPLGEQAGFDLQISGHTHAGQFFPWTLVVRRVHSPHYWGLSRQGRMWVYVSAGTGTWGPPLRLGTRPELTLLKLKTAQA